MGRFLLIAAALIFGSHKLVNYVMSEQFQKYGDDHKAVWTCEVNNVIGNLYMVASRYDRAYDFFARSASRCEGGPAGEQAMFRMGEAQENMGRAYDGLATYEKFIEKYPGTYRAKLATRRIETLKASLR